MSFDAADAVLEEFVRRVNQHLCATDWCARVGGEELIVVLGNAARHQAHQVA